MRISLRRIIALIAVILCIAVAFCGCKSSSDSYVGDNAFTEEAIPGGVSDGVGDDFIDVTDSEQRMLVRTVDIDAETKNFSKFLSDFEAAVKESGGYIQSQSIENRSYNDMRYGNITARIPSDKLDSFVGNISESANIVSHSSEVMDITDEYIDVESRIKSLETEQTALLDMLEKATSLADIMSIQSRLTEVRGQLESYKARQKAFDNQVAYSTVDITISEVERESEANPGFWKQAGDALSDSFKGVGQFLRSFALFVIGASPYLLLTGVVAVVVLVIVMTSIKSARKKRARKQQDK